MKRIKMIIRRTVLLLCVLACIVTASCSKSPLTGWKYKSYEGCPPSWENDFGRPDSYGGEDPWT
jgi:carbonic anhydrase